MRNADNVSVGKRDWKMPLERSKHTLDNNTKFISNKCGNKCGQDSYSSGQRLEAVSCGHGNRPSSSIKVW